MRKNNRNAGLIVIVLTAGIISMCSYQTLNEEPVDMRIQIDQAIKNGDFSAAKKLIDQYLGDDKLSEGERSRYDFELERMRRVALDFTARHDEVLAYIKKYYPEVTATDMERWEAEKSLEFKIINGEKRYFARAARNLFRIDANMKKIWQNLHPDDEMTSGSGAKLDLDIHNAAIIKATNNSSSIYVEPIRLHIKQSLEVLADQVPAGETLRCWIPYPRLIAGRQENIDLVQTQPQAYQLAAPDALQRTIYMEKKARAGETSKFSVEYEFSTRGVFQAIDAERVTMLADKASLSPYLQEEAPHIVFTDELKALSRSIVGDETNPYRKAQLLFSWVDTNTPWASAREYSSIPCIPEYALENHHGDCGIQTLFFITLCRINGIPARWQSGWELHAPG